MSHFRILSWINNIGLCQTLPESDFHAAHLSAHRTHGHRIDLQVSISAGPQVDGRFDGLDRKTDEEVDGWT